MARYGKAHKEATRQRIIDTAGRRLKRDGIDGSGIATLMKDAGLTNGAFYAHFASKDDLVATAVAEQLRQQRANYGAYLPGRAGLEQFVREYLSNEHRDSPEDGCPSAALLDEIGRSSDATKEAFTDGLLISIDNMAAQLSPDDPQSARVKALTVFGMMVGTMQLSRALLTADWPTRFLSKAFRTSSRYWTPLRLICAGLAIPDPDCALTGTYQTGWASVSMIPTAVPTAVPAIIETTSRTTADCGIRALMADNCSRGKGRYTMAFRHCDALTLGF